MSLFRFSVVPQLDAVLERQSIEIASSIDGALLATGNLLQVLS